MAQSFFHTGEHGLVVAGFEIDYAVACKARLGNGGGEQVCARNAPKDLAFGAGGKACAEGSRRRAVDSAVATTGYLMQRAEREAAARES